MNMTPLVPSASYKQLIIGLPGSGKTTFLAALWHVVTTKEVPGSLQLIRFEGDRRHLNKLHKAWLQFREVGRTVQNTEQVVSMKLGLPNSDDSADLVFPDMSGESFRHQWVDRKWTNEYDMLARGSCGVLLFVHPAKVIAPNRIHSGVEDAVSLLDNGQHRNGVTAAANDDTFLPDWDPNKSPTQVQLVELLQFIEQQPHLENIRRVAVLVSAWDLVRARYNSPQDWFAKRLPLLDQYLKANHERFPPRVYGVSAQGGPLDGDISRLQQYEHQSERIQIVGEGCAPHDITAPVKWVMGGG
jgi:hypothetical protein